MANPRARTSDFVSWIERTIHLPLGLSAEPGQITLPIYLREIAAAMDDPSVEKITIQKSARIGFSTLLSSLIAYRFTEKPSPVLLILPAEVDARNAVIGLEEIFDCSPALRGRLPNPSLGRSDRNTILARKGRGGAHLRCVGAHAPRNLRAVAAQVVLIDEADALQDTEGDVIALAEARSLTFRHRLIIIGGTPLLADTSRVARSFAESDQRVFECRCPACGGFAELRWQHFEWTAGQPDTVRWRCPNCAGLVAEADKPRMVREGRWRVLRAEVTNHRGYRLSALVSALPHATWPKLVAQWEAAQGDDERVKAFVNLCLGEPWAEAADEIDEEALAGRAEGFDLDHVPAECLAVTVGADLADDRVELSVVGHGRDGAAYVLTHTVIWGSPLDNDTWSEVEALLRQRWRHPYGGTLKVDAAVIDAGDGGHYDAVMAFCNARLGRRILAGKGVFGFSRAAITSSKTKKGRLFIVGVDSLKSQIINRLARGRTIRFSHTLDGSYFEQLASERRVVRMARGRPVARFERKPGAKAESLDALTYALAAKAALSLNAAAFSQREDELRATVPVKPRQTVFPSRWMTDGPEPW